jgi:3'-phosphoadenosine 5'-phosphosulfate sulfotransferase (PAPS reductase)/FAD synthetase
MRTTLTIDDDVLAAAKAMARQSDRTIGDVISDLARKALDRPKVMGMRNGIPLLTRQTGVPVPITLELVNELRDEFP